LTAAAVGRKHRGTGEEHGMPSTDRASGADDRTARILARVRAIPEGFVLTYGDIDRRAPRFVGHVLATASDDLPWHRVVRADGTIPMGRTQRQRLRKEGVPMRGDRVDLAMARWY
jgi:methylated-DNA-protein-cysteine methyltransferase-like protein